MRLKYDSIAFIREVGLVLRHAILLMQTFCAKEEREERKIQSVLLTRLWQDLINIHEFAWNKIISSTLITTDFDTELLVMLRC